MLIEVPIEFYEMIHTLLNVSLSQVTAMAQPGACQRFKLRVTSLSKAGVSGDEVGLVSGSC